MGIFKIDFDITNYKDILPSYDEYREKDFCINMDEYQKGNVENCYWKKHVPSYAEINSVEFRERENKRILKTGVWICISEEICWIPPNLYFALQYCPAGSGDMQFRLKRLKHAYHKIRSRMNPGSIGVLTLKSRGDGETTMEITDGFWECLEGNMTTGQIGIQSKTRSDGQNPCWSYVKNLWLNLPEWIKTDLCGDFASGTSIAEKMEWMREADDSKGIKARNVLYTFYPSGTPMDGKHDMKLCLLDEVCKWEEGSTFYDVFTNYSKFIMPGFERRGLFSLFSSPADKECKSNEEVHHLWKDSDPNEIVEETGTTKSRIHRYYSNPLEGIAGAYDKFGDADPDKIYAHIMRERAKMPKDKLFAEVRGFPLNEEEMFGSFDGQKMWDNHKGIEARKIYLIGARFKNEKTKEPIKVYGNLEWRGGVTDTEVDFRMSDKTEFDVNDARFCVSYMPQNKEPLKTATVIVRGDNIGERPKPPAYIENCLGIDPYGKRYPGKVFSKGAMVNHKFRDIYETGIVKCPTLIYCNRPAHQEIFFEDAIKAAVFNRAMVQPESINDKIIDWFEDRGYMDWMISKIGHPRNSVLKGDAPSGGKNAYLDEIIGLINAVTNTPLLDTEPYLLELNWFYELLEDVSKFNRLDTHANDLSMAWGASLLGSVKLLYKKVRQQSPLNAGVLDYLLN